MQSDTPQDSSPRPAAQLPRPASTAPDTPDDAFTLSSDISVQISVEEVAVATAREELLRTSFDKDIDAFAMSVENGRSTSLSSVEKGRSTSLSSVRTAVPIPVLEESSEPAGADPSAFATPVTKERAHSVPSLRTTIPVSFVADPSAPRAADPSAPRTDRSAVRRHTTGAGASPLPGLLEDAEGAEDVLVSAMSAKERALVLASPDDAVALEAAMSPDELGSLTRKLVRSGPKSTRLRQAQARGKPKLTRAAGLGHRALLCQAAAGQACGAVPLGGKLAVGFAAWLVMAALVYQQLCGWSFLASLYYASQVALSIGYGARARFPPPPLRARTARARPVGARWPCVLGDRTRRGAVRAHGCCASSGRALTVFCFSRVVVFSACRFGALVEENNAARYFSVFMLLLGGLMFAALVGLFAATAVSGTGFLRPDVPPGGPDDANLASLLDADLDGDGVVDWRDALVAVRRRAARWYADNAFHAKVRAARHRARVCAKGRCTTPRVFLSTRVVAPMVSVSTQVCIVNARGCAKCLCTNPKCV